jgi:hypothetical protein
MRVNVAQFEFAGMHGHTKPRDSTSPLIITSQANSHVHVAMTPVYARTTPSHTRIRLPTQSDGAGSLRNMKILAPTRPSTLYLDVQVPSKYIGMSRRVFCCDDATSRYPMAGYQ